jgi:hypothetical protein
MPRADQAKNYTRASIAAIKKNQLTLSRGLRAAPVTAAFQDLEALPAVEAGVAEVQVVVVQAVAGSVSTPLFS